MGAVYAAAFVSLRFQMDGLIGSRGILPAADFMRAAHAQLGAAAWRFTPSLFLFGASDAALHAVCDAGIAAAAAAVFGLAPAVSLAVAWVCWLSLQVAGQEFLAFQWDLLLLEAGFLAVWCAPLVLVHRTRGAGRPPGAGVLMLRWLLFRLMFSSGVVKLAGGDPLWRSLTALTVHYETQPLPTWTAWYAQQLPRWCHAVSCAIMFVIELAVPFLALLPAPWRALAFPPLAGFQLLLLATGNYAYFNWLALALCCPLLSDGHWPRAFRRRFAAAPTPREWPAPVVLPVFLAVGLGTLVQLAGQFGARPPAPTVLTALHDRLAGWRVVGGYGLFAVMTPRRPEIVVEGSRDGRAWTAYEFRWKPGDPRRRPAFVAPHQPRLDWQMWFAALGSAADQRWFRAFVGRLLEGSPPVLALLGSDPFAGAPPRYVRARLELYRFASPSERARTGAWWTRTPAGAYLPPVSLAR